MTQTIVDREKERKDKKAEQAARAAKRRAEKKAATKESAPAEKTAQEVGAEVEKANPSPEEIGIGNVPDMKGLTFDALAVNFREVFGVEVDPATPLATVRGLVRAGVWIGMKENAGQKVDQKYRSEIQNRVAKVTAGSKKAKEVKDVPKEPKEKKARIVLKKPKTKPATKERAARDPRPLGITSGMTRVTFITNLLRENEKEGMHKTDEELKAIWQAEFPGVDLVPTVNTARTWYNASVKDGTRGLKGAPKSKQYVKKEG